MATVNGNSFGNILIGTDSSDIVSGLAGDDILAGGLGDDQLNGGSGADVLGGGDGDDQLDGGSGADVLVGGNGDDIYFVDSLGDVVVETSLEGGIDSVVSTVSHRLGDHFELLALGGDRNIDGWGNALDNGLIGNDGDNRMFGLAGDDIFLGSNGSDIMDGGLGLDLVDYSDMGQAITLRAAGFVDKGLLGTDQVRDVETIVGATNFRNQIDATSESNSPVFINVNLAQESLLVSGIPGLNSQQLTVRNFVDVVGTSRADSIVGNASANLLWGEAGNDLINGGAGNDVVDGGRGNDELLGGSGDDLIEGGAGDDQIQGGSGNDLIFGDAGNDWIQGGSGADRLIGYGFTPGGEIDTLVGGSGGDIFQLADEVNGSYYREPFDDSYAVIADWDALRDFIQLSDSDSYLAEFRSVSGIGSNQADTVISSEGNIVGIIQDSTNFSFTRDSIFV